MTDHMDLNRHTLPPQLAGLILTVAEEMGVSRGDMLSSTSIRPVLLSQEGTYLSFRQMIRLIQNALRLTNIPWLGLLVGARENISTWGVLGYAVMSCATHREAMEVGLKFHRVAASLMGLRAEEDGERVCVNLETLVPLGKVLPFCVEETIQGICAVNSILIGRPVRPLEVSLTYSKPDYADKLEEYFRCPIHYEQVKNAFWSKTAKETPMQHSDPISARMCLTLVEQMLERHSSEDDFILKVRQILLRSPGMFPDMEAVAEELGMSSRTVRRKLGDLNTSFKAVLDNVKKNLALDYLQNSILTLDRIAGFLGYTETTNFRRAFKQWTGYPPSYYRPRTGE